MALVKIPLMHFTDRTDRQAPIGLITPTGLVSAMRNPMLDSYRDHLLIDYRPRDNWTISRDREEAREARLFITEGGKHGIQHVDEDGAYVVESAVLTTTVATLQVDEELAAGGTLFGLDDDGQGRRIAVMLAAIKVVGLTPSSVDWLLNSHFGYLESGSLGRLIAQLMHTKLDGSPAAAAFEAQLYSHRHTPVSNFAFPSDGNNEIDEDSLDKWILVQLVKEANDDVEMRALGGQFGGFSPISPDSLPLAVDPTRPAWNTDTFRIPLRKQARLGFATLAQYIEGSSSPLPGTGEDEIEWTLFDEEHVCNTYTVSGTRIKFSNTNGVSWEIKKTTDAQWYKEVPALPDPAWVLLSSPLSRLFHDTGTNQTVDPPAFSTIRPVLENTGELNSETLGKLLSASAGTP